MENDVLTPDLIILGYDLLAFKRYYVGMASLLAYDYCLTIGEEQEVIWKGKRSPIFYLYLINRYLPMAFCMITLSAYFSSLWTQEVCDRFAIVKWLETLLIVVPAEALLVFRTWALTNRNKPILIFLISIMIVQCLVVFYAMSQPEKNRALRTPDYLGDAYHVCILFSEPKMDTAYLAISILFDLTVFILTIFRTVNFDDQKVVPEAILSRTMLQDGALYFGVILSGNVTWMICALIGRRGIKLINAQPSMILTSIMITRLTLSLRSAGQTDCMSIPYDRDQDAWEMNIRPVNTFDLQRQ